MGLAGGVLSFAYAVHRLDWVNMAAYALNPIPYARNLVLHARHRASGGDEGAPAPPPDALPDERSPREIA
jgi:hypothetical protein